MEGWSKWLTDLSWPIVSRVLGALGMGTITYTGATEALNSVLDAAKGTIGSLGSEMAQILAMSGFFDYMAITSGGLVTSISWLVLKRFALQTGTASE